ncbi:(-)-isopiperitenol/(-)-carveol dehydrogenase, mitochondrial [Heracleum sosnowskyi]|uniref:(-)-isopiperitenol/(-)-carveol dehydrogenase, mitochondrial n=1 Tax=Heracleum sosnowskyi TaxID=360622 RepID=A0AAD8H075_9APIA|nr:(-)-isopiperitenol/(-)-carveol dehydrogenase, mitochondrial [Heracleum sosnowskyi]
MHMLIKQIMMAEKVGNSLNHKKLEGKVAIITGGASGIGEATARLFAEHGARAIVIADIQDVLGQNVAKSIGTEQCTYMHCDVTNEDQVKALVVSTVKNFGQLDIMFSNAGTITEKISQTILDFDLKASDRLFAINTRGVVACVKHAARAMVRGGLKGGSIICTGSVLASFALPQSIDYVMSKRAVIGLVESASKDLGKYGIRVNCVSPGGVATPLTCRASNFDSVEEGEKFFMDNSRLKGCGPLKVENIANAVLFLASHDSLLITGQNLVVDSGFNAHGLTKAD